MADPALLRADGLRRSYGAHVAVADFTAAVLPGEVVVLVGPNGCGKTTSVEMVLGLRHSDGGTARVLGLDPRRDRREVARSVGVQLQGAALHSRGRLREQLDYPSGDDAGRTVLRTYPVAQANQLYRRILGVAEPVDA